jgi:hypothetical protein
MPAGRGRAADSAAGTAPLQARRGQNSRPARLDGAEICWIGTPRGLAAGAVQSRGRHGVETGRGYLPGSEIRTRERRPPARGARWPFDPIMFIAAEPEYVGPSSQRVHASRRRRQSTPYALVRVLREGRADSQKPSASNDITNHLRVMHMRPLLLTAQRLRLSIFGSRPSSAQVRPEATLSARTLTRRVRTATPDACRALPTAPG